MTATLIKSAAELNDFVASNRGILENHGNPVFSLQSIDSIGFDVIHIRSRTTHRFDYPFRSEAFAETDARMTIADILKNASHEELAPLTTDLALKVTANGTKMWKVDADPALIAMRCALA